MKKWIFYKTICVCMHVCRAALVVPSACFKVDFPTPCVDGRADFGKEGYGHLP